MNFISLVQNTNAYIEALIASITAHDDKIAEDYDNIDHLCMFKLRGGRKLFLDSNHPNNVFTAEIIEEDNRLHTKQYFNVENIDEFIKFYKSL